MIRPPAGVFTVFWVSVMAGDDEKQAVDRGPPDGTMRQGSHHQQADRADRQGFDRTCACSGLDSTDSRGTWALSALLHWLAGGCNPHGRRAPPWSFAACVKAHMLAGSRLAVRGPHTHGRYGMRPRLRRCKLPNHGAVQGARGASGQHSTIAQTAQAVRASVRVRLMLAVNCAAGRARRCLEVCSRQ